MSFLSKIEAASAAALAALKGFPTFDKFEHWYFNEGGDDLTDQDFR